MSEEDRLHLKQVLNFRHHHYRRAEIKSVTGVRPGSPIRRDERSKHGGTGLSSLLNFKDRLFSFHHGNGKRDHCSLTTSAAACCRLPG